MYIYISFLGFCNDLATPIRCSKYVARSQKLASQPVV